MLMRKRLKLLIIDNYDSFTYNLVQIVEQLALCEFEVFKNDQIDIDSLDQYDKILISPGPGLPEEVGIVLRIIKQYSPSKSILGVCLGHQAIGVCFGAKLRNLNKILHGQSTKTNIIDKDDYLFNGIDDNFDAGRYHSWVLDPASLPEELEVTATDHEGNIMAISHKNHDVKGVQFHPESILTPSGKKLIKNWLAHQNINK